MSSGQRYHYGVLFFMTQVSKPDMKPVNHRFQEVLASEILQEAS